MVVKTIGAVSAFALLASMSGVALAQTSGGQDQERMQAPGQSNQQMAPGQRQSTPGQKQGGGQAEPQRSQGQAQQQDGTQQKQQKQAEEPQRKQQKQQAEQPQRKQQKQAEQPERKQQKQAEEPQRKQQKQQAEQPQRKQQKQQAEQPQRKQQQQAERDGRQRLSQQQRTSVRERIRQSGDLDRARVSSVNFNVSVGTRVPSGISLVPLPAVIVEEVPAYRGYVYFVVRDELVIVQPSTQVIVDVIRLDGASSQSAQVRGLTLSAEERRIILSNIEMRPSVRLGIGGIEVGTSLPRNVDLRSFPRAVTAEIPELRQYRYIVFENEIAVVSPNQRKVVLTISE